MVLGSRSHLYVVSIPGNAGGAKGWRFETACDRYTALHREDSVRGNLFTRASLGRRAGARGQARKRPAFRGNGRRESMGFYAHPIGDDSSWEPDGVTLQVRFCEEPGTNCRMAEILWHRRETRRQTEKTNFGLTVARTRLTPRPRVVFGEVFLACSRFGPFSLRGNLA